MLFEKIAWVGSPSEKYNKRLKMWPKYTLWPYKLKGSETEYVMDETEYNIFLSEKKIFDKINELPSKLLQNTFGKQIIDLIEEYGEQKHNKGRYDEWNSQASHDPSY